ncbi:biliverdin-producing heme oxygenase [Epilithonimonas xixisoli]|uniref:Heme oxygenase n=1 Tax=Epilithonimonas xixisoli TaxID=1476462 RepID=A0A4R8IDZ0_9FLAO|nr:biliverdin-producing heme oxygenase [Epilithonimonas xixisoli]TDX83281.1 heme oxygenase [Epilithonimonas xixisoli]
MISAYLKEQTKQQHDDTEAKLQSQKIFDKSYTLDDYKTLLIHNYKLINRYEPQIQEQLKNYPELKLDLRSKIESLKTDLNNLNIPTENEAPIQNLENEAEAFGALYVMEGSTLGGNVIAKQLKKNPEFEGVEFNYFGVYGENTGPYWQEFKSIIDEKISEENYESCVTGAKKAYQLLS